MDVTDRALTHIFERGGAVFLTGTGQWVGQTDCHSDVVRFVRVLAAHLQRAPKRHFRPFLAFARMLDLRSL